MTYLPLVPCHKCCQPQSIIFWILEFNVASGKTCRSSSSSEPKIKDGKKPASAGQYPSAKDHLPGGQKYVNAVDAVYGNGNPRQGKPVPQWLREWEEKWQRITSEDNRNG